MRLIKRKIYTILIIFLVFVLIIGVNIINLINIENEKLIYDDKDFIISNDNNSISQELIEEGKEEKDIEKEINDVLNKYVENIEGELAISFYDINSKTYIGVKDNDLFIAGSTIKVPIAMLICDLVQNEELNLNNELYYSYSDYEGGSGVMQDMDLSRSFTIKELVENMIVYSDNIATNILIRHLGYQRIKMDIGEMINDEISTIENTITPEQSYKFLKLLYENSDKNENYNWLIGLLKNTVFHNRIDNKIPQEIVAHKIGDYEEYVHDIAIIYASNPYILSIYTKNIKNANELISNLSLDVNIIMNYIY